LWKGAKAVREPYEILWKLRRIKRRGTYGEFEQFLKTLTKEEWEELRDFAEAIVETADVHLVGMALLEQIRGSITKYTI
jgi:hypothetical protein